MDLKNSFLCSIIVLNIITAFFIAKIYLNSNSTSNNDLPAVTVQIYGTEKPKLLGFSASEPRPFYNISKLFNGKYNPNKTKYLIYQCIGGSVCGGWADRLKGILGTFLWAVFTNRTYLIDVDRPCDLRLIMASNIIKWDENIEEIKEKYTNGKLSHFKFRAMDGRSLQSSINFHEFQKDVDVLIVEINSDLYGLFSQNPLYRGRLKDLGFNMSSFQPLAHFHFVYNLLFRLQPNIQKRYDDFMLEAKPTTDTALICVQVRIGGIRPNVVFDGKFNNINNSILFWKYVESSIIPLHQNYKLFITTDTESVEQEAVKYFGPSEIVRINGVFTNIDRDVFKNNKNDCSRHEKAYLDFHALQNCDEAVISRSGYGFYGISNRKKKFKFSVFDGRNPAKPIFEKMNSL